MTCKRIPLQGVFARIGTILLGTALVLGPLPLGSARPLPALGLALLCGLAAVCSALDASPAHRGRALPRWALLCLGAALSWPFVQQLPLPPGPWTHPAHAEAALVLGTVPEGRIALRPADTGLGHLHWLVPAAAFAAACRLGADAARARRLLAAAALAGGIYALHGLAVYATGNATVLHMPKWAYPDALTATFVNRNDFAAFAGLSIVAAVASLQLAARHGARSLPLLWAALAALAIALPLTASRAGVASAAAAIALQAAVTAWKRPRLRISPLLMLGLALVPVVAMSGTIAARLAEAPAALETRLALSRASLSALAEAPLTGIGPGAFADAVAPHLPPVLMPHVVWDSAHSAWIGGALALGLPAFALLLAGLARIVLGCAGTVRRRRRGWVLPLAACAAALQMALHGVFDEPLSVPAVATLAAVLLGLGAAQAGAHGGTAARPSDSAREIARTASPSAPARAQT